MALIAILVLVSALTRPGAPAGVAAGQRVPPFAAPLALGGLNGTVNVARHANEGRAKRPACSVRGAQVLNICELYERGPVALALFIDAGGCANVLGELQRMAPQTPGVRFAAVAIKGDRSGLRKLLRSRGVTLPVGYDEEGGLVSLYRMVDCPQIELIERGGVAQGAPLFGEPSQATLRARVRALIQSSRQQGR